MGNVLATAWRRVAATALLRMLALSVSLHLAVIMVVQPAPGSAQPRTVVIQARLSQVEPAPEPPAAMPPAPLPETAEPAALAPSPSPAAPIRPPEPLPVAKPDKPEAPVPLPPATALARPPSAARAEAAPSEASQRPPEPSPPAPVAAPSSVAVPSPNADPASRTSEGRQDGLPRIAVPFDTRWYAARELDLLPKAQGGIRYQYPESARVGGIEGTVLVLIKVDELGRVRDLEILESSPPGVFDATVKEVLSQIVFTPARRDGVPVRALLKHRVRFELD